MLLLPAFPSNGTRYLGREDQCSLNDVPDTSLVALLRRREGRPPVVEQLWTYNLEEGRMEKQPPARAACRATD